MGDIGIGAPLREARTALGRTVDDIAATTRMRAAQVHSIEDEEFGIFGGDVYAKGFIKSYAQAVEVDPEPLLVAYRRYVQHDAMDSAALTAGPVTTTAPRPAPPAWIGWVAGLLLIAGGGYVLTQFIGTRVPEQAVEDEATTPPAPVASPEPSAEPDAEETAEPAPEPSPEPTFEGVNVVLAFEQQAWIRVSSGGQVITEGTQEPGAAVEFVHPEALQIRIGNAGGVRARLNGEDVGSLGGSGEVVVLNFTEDGVEPT